MSVSTPGKRNKVAAPSPVLDDLHLAWLIGFGGRQPRAQDSVSVAGSILKGNRITVQRITTRVTLDVEFSDSFVETVHFGTDSAEGHRTS